MSLFWLLKLWKFTRSCADQQCGETEWNTQWVVSVLSQSDINPVLAQTSALWRRNYKRFAAKYLGQKFTAFIFSTANVCWVFCLVLHGHMWNVDKKKAVLYIVNFVKTCSSRAAVWSWHKLDSESECFQQTCDLHSALALSTSRPKHRWQTLQLPCSTAVFACYCEACVRSSGRPEVTRPFFGIIWMSSAAAAAIIHVWWRTKLMCSRFVQVTAQKGIRSI